MWEDFQAHICSKPVIYEYDFMIRFDCFYATWQSFWIISANVSLIRRKSFKAYRFCSKCRQFCSKFATFGPETRKIAFLIKMSCVFFNYLGPLKVSSHCDFRSWILPWPLLTRGLLLRVLLEIWSNNISYFSYERWFRLFQNKDNSTNIIEFYVAGILQCTNNRKTPLKNS